MTADPMQRAEVAALVALAEAGIRPDTQEMLVHGNALHGIRPGALRKALAAALLTREEEVRGEEWQSIETAPDDEPFMAGLWVSNNKTGQRWWEAYLVSIDDETGEAKYWPDGELLPWTLQDFDAWHSIPAPPAIRSANCGGGEK